MRGSAPLSLVTQYNHHPTTSHWESAPVLGGHKNEHFSNCFTIWKNLVLSISHSKDNHFKVHKKCHDIPQFASINQLLPQFIFLLCRSQCWLPQFPMCIGQWHVCRKPGLISCTVYGRKFFTVLPRLYKTVTH